MKIRRRVGEVSRFLGFRAMEFVRPLTPAYRRRMKLPVMHVMTSCTNKKVQVVQVLIRSLSETHPHNRIVLWFAHVAVSSDNLEMLDAFCRKLPNVDFRPLRYAETELLRSLRELGGKPDVERFLWFTAHEHLPASVERLIYIDALDTLVVDDLSAFYSGDFSGKLLLCCREINQYSKAPSITVPSARKHFAAHADVETIKRMSFGLFNSGSIVLNMERFRAERLGLEIYAGTARWAAKEMGLRFGDQGLFSLTHGSDFLLCGDRYNTRFFNPRTRLPDNPALIHFCGFAPKPSGFLLTDDEWRAVEKFIALQDGAPPLFTKYSRVFPHYRKFYDAWWDVCSRCPVETQIRPQARVAVQRWLSAKLISAAM